MAGLFYGNLLGGLRGHIMGAFMADRISDSRSPFFGREVNAVAASLVFYSLEFGGIKIPVVELLPDPKKEDCILVLQPPLDQRVASIEVAHHTGGRNEVLVVVADDGDISPRTLRVALVDFIFTRFLLPQMTQMGADEDIGRNICGHLRNLRFRYFGQPQMAQMKTWRGTSVAICVICGFNASASRE